MASEKSEISPTDIYGFNIVLEAKLRAMVLMTKRFHPEMSTEEIERFLKSSVEYAVRKELGKK